MSTRQPLTLPPHVNPAQSPTATAPYNFVPLPELVVPAVESAEALPDHDHYDSNRRTGYFEVTLLTRSPLYVRCPLTTDQLLRQDRGDDAKLPFREQVKNTPDFFYTRDPNQPVIPGSSLRGMLRGLLEIISYGKVQWVTDTLKVFYRAVAAAKDDPLGEPYRQVLGKFGSNVSAGYLVKKGHEWYIKPAKRPADMGWPEKQAYLKIKEDRILADAIPGLVRFSAPNYRPQYHPVSFDVEIRKGKRGPFLAITRIGPADAGYAHRGVLICSGSMLETGGEDSVSPRKNHALVLEEDHNARLLKINAQAVADHLDALTPFQTEPPFDIYMGFLLDAHPIFYVEGDGEVFFFGHSPNFRVQAFLKRDQRAATPMDLVPPALRRPEEIDYAEALFGFVRTRQELENMKQWGLPVPKPGAKGRAYAGRVCVTDAALAQGQSDIWLTPEPLIPKILTTPKPTAFQHYLVQTSDKRNSLKHYDSASPNETVIRGHKLYWHQKADWLSPDDARRMIEEDGGRLAEITQQEVKGRPDTQHTQFRPVKAGVQFRFRIYFENLSDEEIGALCWTLRPLADPSKDHCHSLGMGKPLGMGAVELQATMYLTRRTCRYARLFDGDRWQTGITSEQETFSDAKAIEQLVPIDPTGIARAGEKLTDRAMLERLVEPFEKRILETLQLYPTHKHLFELTRVGILLSMLEWPGLDPQGARYMEVNQFKDRLVLPDPSDPEAFGPLTGQAKPEPDTLKHAGKAAATHPTAAVKGAPGLTMKGPSPEPKQPTVSIKKELVTLVENATQGRARVQTTQGELIPCSQFPSSSYPSAEAGMRCRAKVTRQDGQAKQATFDRWE